MVAALLSEPAKEVAETAAKAGLTVIESSVLGAFAILCLIVAGLAVWKLSKVQDARVSDQKESGEALRAASKELTTAAVAMSASIEKFAQAEREGQLVLERLKGSMDTIVLTAVQRSGGRTYSPPPAPGSKSRGGGE